MALVPPAGTGLRPASLDQTGQPQLDVEQLPVHGVGMATRATRWPSIEVGAIIRAAVIALFVAVALIGVRVVSTTSSSPPPWDAHPFDAPTNGVDRALLLHDGQTYAALAQDPLLDRPELFYGNAEEEAYRASRPMLGWLAWALSFGQSGLVPEALLALTILSTAAMVASGGWLASLVNRDPRTAWGLVALPGAIAATSFIGLTDALATALALAGFSLWRTDRAGWAVAAFAAAILTRETGVLAVVAILLVERRRALALLWSTPPYAAWLVVVRLRLGHWPFGASDDGARYTVPFAGWWRALENWGPVHWTIFVAVGGIVATGWRRLPQDLQVFVGLWVVVAVCLGWQVWWKSFDFPRVLLPLTAVAAIGLLPAREPDPSPTGA